MLCCIAAAIWTGARQLLRLFVAEMIPGMRTYPVLPPISVTVLQTLIILKFVHQRFIEKYEWIEHVSMYHHDKFEVVQV